MRFALRPSRRGSVMLTAAAALLFPVIALASPASAQPASPAQPAGIVAGASGTMCNGGGDDCWSIGASSTGPVTDSSSSATAVLVEGSPVSCSTVNSTCPFADTNLDMMLEGHSIVAFELLNQDGDPCADSTSGFNVSGGSCSGSHAAYVPVDNGLQFISVGASNLDHADGHFSTDIVYIQGAVNSQLQLLPSQGGETWDFSG